MALAALFLPGRKQSWRECPRSRARRGGEGAGEPFPGPGNAAGPQHRVGVTADGAYVWRRRDLPGTDVGGGPPVSEGSRAPCRRIRKRYQRPAVPPAAVFGHVRCVRASRLAMVSHRGRRSAGLSLVMLVGWGVRLKALPVQPCAGSACPGQSVPPACCGWSTS